MANTNNAATVARLYNSVIDEVIASCRALMEEETGSADLEILEHIKDSWKRKVDAAKAVPDPSTMVSNPSTVQASGTSSGSKSKKSKAASAVPSQLAQLNDSINNANNINNKNTQSVIQSTTDHQAPYNRHIQHPQTSHSIRSTLPQVDGDFNSSSESSMDSNDDDDDSNEDEDDDDEEREKDETSASRKSGKTEPTDLDDEAAEQEDSPLNSEDDVSDDDPQGDLFETDNVVVCQYDKITRSRNKWKFHLKDGIMNLKGKDYVFQKLLGDAEW